MTTLRRPWLLLTLLIVSVLEANATLVYHKKLQEVVKPNRPIFLATLVRTDTKILPNKLQVVVQVDKVELVYLGTPEASVFTHNFRTDLERRRLDGSITRVSPIREGSGLEQSLVPGQRYLFILSEDHKDLIRVEPQGKLDEVRRILAKFKP